MKKRIYTYILFSLLYSPLLWRGAGGEAFAQSYPVHITTQLVAPFSGYLPDYANAGEEKLKILVLFTDFTKPSYNIKLKISIQGQGVSIQSQGHYFSDPFNIQPGVPLEISGSELSGLLNSQNLDFNGINKAQYEQRKVLPEGFYTFCITAYDNNNPIPIQVSNTSCAQGWMILSDPPFLNLPICSSTVTTTNPQQQTFSFTQMNMGSPNSAANTEYVFELWEIRPQGAIPNNIVQTVPPIYSYTTNLTSINYGITEPPLLKGMQYVWRVKAIDITGRDLFKNQGNSQICTFTYGSVLDGSNINLNLHGQGISQRQIKVWWDSLSVFTDYNVEFRKAGSGGNWYPATTSNKSLRILDLEPQTTYEVHVQGISTDYTSPFSPGINVSTLAMPNYQCGEMPVVPNSAQFQPLTLATTNMVWQVGQFEMSVTQLQNIVSGSGMYSGSGKISMPYVGKVNCKFTNVLVNSDQVVVGGKVIALTEGVNAWVNSNSVGTIQDGTVDPEVHVNSPLTTSDINVTTSNGTFTVGGNTYTYTPSGSTIEDSDGNIFVVTSNGQIISAGTAGTGHGPVPESKNIINTAKGKINFTANATQLYGLDEYKHPELINYYLTVKNVTDNTHQQVNWKSVMAQKYDVIDLDYELNSGLKADSILFITGTGTIYKPQGSGTNRKLYIVGGKHGDVQELFACYKVKKDSFINIAKINIVSYRNEQNKVTLVPLGNNISIDKMQLQQQLNSIYKQSVATWVVDVAPAITVGDTLWDKDGNGHINVGSNMFSRYSTELKAINKYIRKQTYYNASEYFLIVTNKPTDSLSADLQGEMPRARNIGYMFTATPKAELIAHELGHGAFALEHSFDGNATLPKGSSACLMDYNNGTDLYKGKYWDYVHNPVTVVGVFEDDSSSMSADYQRKKVFEWLTMIKDACKNNTSITLQKGSYINYNISSVYLAGLPYDFIRVSSNNSIEHTVYPKNKITMGTSEHYYASSGLSEKVPCLDIDGGLIKIEAPQNRLILLKAYLESAITSRNLLLFVNGYRNNAPSLDELPRGNDDVSELDQNNYWSGIDASFTNRIGTRNVIYADGHHSISTSNHIDQSSFLSNLTEWQCAANLTATAYTSLANIPLAFACYRYYHDATKFKLHTKANSDGFTTRRRNGNNAGLNLLLKLTNGSITCRKDSKGNIIDTLDIVCHSFGYAYTLGMCDALKGKIHFGRLYCVAPENACSGQITLTDFEEVWQYGSNEDPINGDLVWEQDGVAPQCAVQGITKLPKLATIGGRVFIPNTWSHREFLGAHYIDNYIWIFSELIPNDFRGGYVKPR